ncbi:MAG: DUF4352 domain-containing protein [Actinobacteria bacterium]|nr:MAG: DUF4352 domain-containing protein [Actinomycetota bacterium]RIK07607.1 MAG: hypothetical protein DCC48_03690 [Acidobacteriota bacterium]
MGFAGTGGRKVVLPPEPPYAPPAQPLGGTPPFATYQAPQAEPGHKGPPWYKSPIFIGAVVLGLLVVIVLTVVWTSGGEETADPTTTTTTEPENELGSRSNPVPLGEAFAVGEWEITINAVEPDATEVITEHDQENPPPAEGEQYVLVDMTAAYVGSDPDGALPDFEVKVVSSSGSEHHAYDSWCGRVPEEFDFLTQVEPGDDVTGNVCIAVPSEEVPGMLIGVGPWGSGDAVFFATE